MSAAAAGQAGPGTSSSAGALEELAVALLTEAIRKGISDTVPNHYLGF